MRKLIYILFLFVIFTRCNPVSTPETNRAISDSFSSNNLSNALTKHIEESTLLKDSSNSKGIPKEAIECYVECWLSEEINNIPLSVYPFPKDSGGIIVKLNKDCGYAAIINYSYKGWSQVTYIHTGEDCEDSIANTQKFDKYYGHWVKPGYLSTQPANDGGNKLKLFRYAADTAKVIGYTISGWTILGANGDWILVKGFTHKGKETEGWVPKVVQCMNPYTNCNRNIDKYYYNEEDNQK